MYILPSLQTIYICTSVVTIDFVFYFKLSSRAQHDSTYLLFQVLRRLRQKDHESEASLDYIVRHYLKTNAPFVTSGR